VGKDWLSVAATLKYTGMQAELHRHREMYKHRELERSTVGKTDI